MLSKLSRDLRKTRKAAYAAGTHKNHRTQWRSYLYFCLHFKLAFLPASISTISLYCQFLSRSMTPPSVRNYLSGVKLLHVMLGYSFPDLSTHEIQVTLRGIDRLAQHCPLRAPPITPQLLGLLVSVGHFLDPIDVTFSCAFVFAFFLFARISNLVPDSLSADNAYHCLRRGDILPSHYGLCVKFSWSKTNQFGTRVLELPLIGIPDSPFCPVRLFYLMCELVPAPSHTPLFVFLSHSGVLKPVLKRQFISVLRARLEAANVAQSHTYRGHSFRRGGTSWAFSAGLPGELIQVFGDWRSDAYKSYLDISMALKLRVAQGMVRSLGSSSPS